MRYGICILLPLFFLILYQGGCSKEDGFTALKEPYFGQKPPGMTPAPFAPGIINAEAQTHSTVTVSPQGDEIYWSIFSTISDVRQERIWYTTMEGGKWTQPVVAPFSGEYRTSGPQFSPDGQRLYFASLRPTSEKDTVTDANIWVIERIGKGWSKPRPLESPVNSPYQEWYPSVSKNGNLYFMFRKDDAVLWDIYCSKLTDGKYTDPKRLGDSVNSPYVEGFSFIDPDERYLMFYSERPGGGSDNGELYISFLKSDGSWTGARAIGERIQPAPSRFPGLSTDGKYFFFACRNNEKEIIYWVDSKIIEDLK